MSSFHEGEGRWIERLGNLRNVIRQELIGRQLGDQVAPGAAVLDVGSGQGTQALRLAGRGCRVTGIAPSPALLPRCSAAASAGDEPEARRANLRIATSIWLFDREPDR